MRNKFIKENENSKYVLEASSSMLHELIKFSGLEPELYLMDSDEYPEADFNMEAFEKEMLVVANNYLKEVFSEIKNDFDGLNDIKAIGIFRPKEYNTYSDDINIDLIISQLFVDSILEYYNEVKKSNPKKFIDYLKKYYISYEGFNSMEAKNIVEVDNILAEKNIDDKEYKHVLIQLFNYKLYDTKVLEGLDFERYCIRHFEGDSYGEYIVEKVKNKFKHIMNEKELLDLKFIKNINEFDKTNEISEEKYTLKYAEKLIEKAKEYAKKIGKNIYVIKSGDLDWNNPLLYFFTEYSKNSDFLVNKRLNGHYNILKYGEDLFFINSFDKQIDDEKILEYVEENEIFSIKSLLKNKFDEYIDWLKANEKKIEKDDDDKCDTSNPKVKCMKTAMKKIEKAVGEKVFDFKSIKCDDDKVFATVRIVNHFYNIECKNVEDDEKTFVIYIKNKKVFKGELEEVIEFVNKKAKAVKTNETEMNEAWYNTKDEKADLSEIDSIVAKIQTELDVTLDKAEINMFKGLEKLNTNKISLTNFINSNLPVDEKIKQLETAMKNAEADKYKGYILFTNGVLNYVSFSKFNYKTNAAGANI